MAHFEVKTSAEPGLTVLTVAGECDLAARDELTSALLAAVAGAKVVVVDLAALEFLDSTGLNSLVTAHHVAQDGGGHLYLVNATGAVTDVLDITGIGDLLRPPADVGDPFERS